MLFLLLSSSFLTFCFYYLSLFLFLELSLMFYFLYFYLFFFVFFMFFTLNSSLPFIFILNSSVVILFFSLVLWLPTLLNMFLYLNMVYSLSFFSLSVLFLFNYFIYLLRPVTLSLRIFINVSVGHYLMLMVHYKFFYWLFLISILELFIYFIQFFVFMSLILSYY